MSCYLGGSLKDSRPAQQVRCGVFQLLEIGLSGAPAGDENGIQSGFYIRSTGNFPKTPF